MRQVQVRITGCYQRYRFMVLVCRFERHYWAIVIATRSLLLSLIPVMGPGRPQQRQILISSLLVLYVAMMCACWP